MANLKDSGERTAYETGAVRDCKEGKGRCDLMPLDILADLMKCDVLAKIHEFKVTGDIEHLYTAIRLFIHDNAMIAGDADCWGMLLEVAKHFEDGAKKYGPNNWQRGIPIHSYIDSAVRHYMKYQAGWVDEPHDRAFIWNLICCAWTMKHRREMDDFTDAKRPEGICADSCSDNRPFIKDAVNMGSTAKYGC